MTYEIQAAHEVNDRALVERFESLINVAAPILRGMAAEWHVPDVKATLVLADDFIGVVDRELNKKARRHSVERQPFTTGRIAGTTAAKNISSSADDSTVTIVFDSGAFAETLNADEAGALFTIAHELTHPPITRMRRASGALDGVPYPSQTPSQLARSLGRSAADEYRADVVASALVTPLLTDWAGPTEDALYTPYDRAHQRELLRVLDELVHPRWLDLIAQHLAGRTDLDEVLAIIVRETDGVMTASAHAEAERIASGQRVVELAEHPGGLIVGPAWAAIMKVIGAHDLVPDFADFNSVDTSLADGSENAILAMWAALGI